MANGGVTCPLPTGHSYADVKAAYDKAKKDMPDLTPAAWRKAAAQSLGMDYNSYLAIWKTKGKVPLIPGSTPTLPAAAPQVAMKVPVASKQSIGNVLTKSGFKKQSYTKPMQTHTGASYGGGSKLIEGYKTYDNVYDGYVGIEWIGENAAKYLDDMYDILKAKGYNVKKVGNSLRVSTKATEAIKEAVQGAAQKTAAKQAATKMPVKKAASKQISADDAFKKDMDDAIAAYKNGDLDADDIKDMIGDFALEHSNGSAIKFHKLSGLGDELLDAAKKVKPSAPAPTSGGGIITKQGIPLDNASAKAAYSKMKAQMPGSSPATIRHAAADYLGVDYNDYLKAWKMKPGASAAVKANNLPNTPSSVSSTLSPSPTGKYVGKTPTSDEIIDELMKLYGPNAQKGYMNVSLSAGDEWYTLIPNSLVPTAAGKEAVAASLKKMGFNVKLQGNKLWLWTDEAKKVIAKNAQQVAQTGVKTLPSGVKVLDADSAKSWTTKWWNGLSSETQSAWKSYTGGGYGQINSFLRHGKGGDYVRKQVKAIKASMQRTKHEFQVIRDTHISINQFKTGQLWSDDGFMSTTIKEHSVFGGNVHMEITVSPGTKGMYIGHKSSHPSEMEFLLDASTKFRVLSVKGSVVRLITIP